MLALPVQQIPWVSWKLASQLQTEVRPLFPTQSPGCQSPLQTWTENRKMKTPTDQILGRLSYTGKKSSWGIVIFCNTYQSSIPIYDWFRPKPSKVSLLTSFIHPLTPYKAVCVIFCRSMLPTANAHWLDFTFLPTIHSFFPRLPHVACRYVYYSAGGKEEERVQNSWFAKGGGAKQLRNSYTRSTLENSSVPF